MTLALMVLGGGVALLLGVLFVYAVVSPDTRVRQAPPVMSNRSSRSCIYCHCAHTRRLGQEPRYDAHGFALVTTYECMRCGLPFWCVDRSPAQQRSH